VKCNKLILKLKTIGRIRYCGLQMIVYIFITQTVNSEQCEFHKTITFLSLAHYNALLLYKKDMTVFYFDRHN